MIRFCGCAHEYQDAMYGHQQRVHNVTQKDGKVSGYRCTVCGHKKAA